MSVPFEVLVDGRVHQEFAEEIAKLEAQAADASDEDNVLRLHDHLVVMAASMRSHCPPPKSLRVQYTPCCWWLSESASPFGFTMSEAGSSQWVGEVNAHLRQLFQWERATRLALAGLCAAVRLSAAHGKNSTVFEDLIVRMGERGWDRRAREERTAALHEAIEASKRLTAFVLAKGRPAKVAPAKRKAATETNVKVLKRYAKTHPFRSFHQVKTDLNLTHTSVVKTAINKSPTLKVWKSKGAEVRVARSVASKVDHAITIDATDGVGATLQSPSADPAEQAQRNELIEHIALAAERPGTTDNDRASVRQELEGKSTDELEKLHEAYVKSSREDDADEKKQRAFRKAPRVRARD